MITCPWIRAKFNSVSQTPMLVPHLLYSRLGLLGCPRSRDANLAPGNLFEQGAHQVVLLWYEQYTGKVAATVAHVLKSLGGDYSRAHVVRSRTDYRERGHEERLVIECQGYAVINLQESV
jgi:hypothetical protein